MTCLHPRHVWYDKVHRSKISFDPVYDYFWQEIEIPCGNCIGCLRRRSADWTIRLLGEHHFETFHNSQNNPYKQFSFITLTFDDYSLPDDYQENLHMELLSEFFRHLRDNNRKHGLPVPKFFGCGERGKTTKRLHYHALVYGENFMRSFDGVEDTKIVGYNQKISQPYYSTKKLRDHWKKGHVVCVPMVNEPIACYCSGYMMKDERVRMIYVGSGDNLQEKDLREETKDLPRTSAIRCSTNLGKEFFRLYKDQFVDQGVIRSGNRVYGLPRYFKKMLDKEFPEDFQKVQERAQEYLKDPALQALRTPDMLRQKEEILLQKFHERIRPYENNCDYCTAFDNAIT
ncbi:replication initiator protein [Capybara microvirus Cap1_SP_140]|nr:replication initiator protein [Capybara microvirus Cap1_SP_140]